LSRWVSRVRSKSTSSLTSGFNQSGK